MKPIAIFYHALFLAVDPPIPPHIPRAVVAEQMATLMQSGLTHAADEFHIGINGGKESVQFAQMVFPPKANITYHGLQCRNENLTILMLEEWAKTHPDWLVFYFHAKGATAQYGTEKYHRSTQWRHTMMHDLVLNWRQCVYLFESGYDVVCSHWKWNQCDGSQNIAAGNFWWATSNFLAKLPSIMLRERIKISGIGALASRYEAEVWIGNGPRPNVKQFRPTGGGGIP
jgi:hypothetical protein